MDNAAFHKKEVLYQISKKNTEINFWEIIIVIE